MITPELQALFAEWRAKTADGTITLDEMKAAVKAMRENRRGAAAASEQARRTKARGAVKTADELLNELEGL